MQSAEAAVDFPITVSGPFGSPAAPAHEQVTIMEAAICDAVARSLDLPAGVMLRTDRLEKDRAFRGATLNLLWRDFGPVETFGVRVNGFVQRAGVTYLSVSVRGTTQGRVMVQSEDLTSTPKKCGLMLLADPAHQVVPFPDDLRARVEAAAPQPARAARPAKKAAAPVPVLVADAPIRAIFGSPDGSWLCSTHENQTVTLWDASTGKRCWSKRAGGAGMKLVNEAAFAPDGAVVASGSSSVVQLDLATGAAAPLRFGATEELVSVRWREEGLLTANNDNVRGAKNRVTLWDPRTGAALREWRWKQVSKAAFVPGARAVVAFGRRDELSVQTLCRMELDSDAVVTARVDEDLWSMLPTRAGIWIVTPEGFQLRDPSTLAVLRTLPYVRPWPVAVDPSGQILLVATGSRIQRLDPMDGSTVAEWGAPAHVGGMAEHLAAIDARSDDLPIRYDDAAPDVVAMYVSEDRIFAATKLVIGCWDLNGTPVLSPSLTGS